MQVTGCLLVLHTSSSGIAGAMRCYLYQIKLVLMRYSSVSALIPRCSLMVVALNYVFFNRARLQNGLTDPITLLCCYGSVFIGLFPSFLLQCTHFLKTTSVWEQQVIWRQRCWRMQVRKQELNNDTVFKVKFVCNTNPLMYLKFALNGLWSQK